MAFQRARHIKLFVFAEHSPPVEIASKFFNSCANDVLPVKIAKRLMLPENIQNFR
jgi:hypothetical protein